jgi:hypothetical protein
MTFLSSAEAAPASSSRAAKTERVRVIGETPEEAEGTTELMIAVARRAGQANRLHRPPRPLYTDREETCNP